MRNVSIDLDYIKYFNLDKDEIINELNTIRALGVSTLVMPYEIFLNKELEEFKDKILRCLSQVNFNIVLRAQSIRNYYSTYIDDAKLDESITVHKQFIYSLYNDFKEKNITNKLSIIFTGGVCKGNDINIYYDKAVYFFRELASGVSNIDVDILLENTLIDYRMGRLVGNLWKDFSYLLERIGLDNFGVSWNMKNSRINSSEYADELIPPLDILKRVKFSVITNQSSYEETAKQFSGEMQYEEMKSLINANANCIFSLEFIYSYINENGLPYENVYDSIEYLTFILTYFYKEKEKHDLDVTLDPGMMKRKSIRRVFDKDTMAIIDDNTYKFDEIEISENDIKLNSEALFNYMPEENYKIIVKSNDILIELDTTLIYIRNNQLTYDYIFKINNKDRITRKRLCELIYLTD